MGIEEMSPYESLAQLVLACFRLHSLTWVQSWGCVSKGRGSISITGLKCIHPRAAVGKNRFLSNKLLESLLAPLNENPCIN